MAMKPIGTNVLSGKSVSECDDARRAQTGPVEHHGAGGDKTTNADRAAAEIGIRTDQDVVP
jgi:hypothetical protein